MHCPGDREFFFLHSGGYRHTQRLETRTRPSGGDRRWLYDAETMPPRPRSISQRVLCQNPAGTITRDLVGALRRAIDSPPALVIVEGEEDLAVIPLALLVAPGSIVIYGQPGEGVVIRRIDEGAREDARRLLSFFVSDSGETMNL